MADRVKILTFSDSINIPTGYSRVCKEVFSRLNPNEFDIVHWGKQTTGNPAFTSYFHDFADLKIKDIYKEAKEKNVLNSVEEFNSWFRSKFAYQIGGHREADGKDKYNQFLRNEKPDIYFQLLDLWMANWVLDCDFTPTKSVLYFPLDGYPVPQGCQRHLLKADVPVAMSKFGKAVAERYEYFEQTEGKYIKLSERMTKPIKYIPHGCFQGDTLIETEKGKAPIKHIVSNKKAIKIWGINHLNKLELTKIKNYQKIKVKDNLLFLITDNGHFLEITKDNLIFSKGKYIPAGDLKLKDKVYIPNGINTNYELGISCRNNRRGREHKHNKMQKKTVDPFITKDLYNKFKLRIDEIFKIEWVDYNKTRPQPHIKNTMLQGNNIWVKKFKNFNKDIAFFNNKKEASKIIKNLYRIENTKKGEGSIYGPRKKYSSKNKKIEYEKIVTIIEFKPKYKFVYDLTTETHNFLANEILVHNCNTEVFKPLPQKERDELKIKDGLDGKFVVGMVGRNQPRKSHERLFKAFSEFQKDKSDVILFLHTDARDPQGFDLNALSQRFNVQPRYTKMDSFMWGVPDETLNKIYNIFDVHINSSTGEGFSLPSIEAAAAGKAQILVDYTSSAELLNYERADPFYPHIHQEGNLQNIITKQGILVPPTTLLCGTMNVERAIPDVNKMIEALQYSYDNQDELKEMGRIARNFSLQYDWDLITKQWETLFKETVNNA